MVPREAVPWRLTWWLRVRRNDAERLDMMLTEIIRGLKKIVVYFLGSWNV